MASVYSAGSASVQIVPDFSNAQRRIGQWFARQKDMKVSVQPDLDNGAMQKVHAEVASRPSHLHIEINRREVASKLKEAVQWATGVDEVQHAVQRLFTPKNISLTNLGGAAVALGSALSQAAGAAALLPATLAAVAAPVATIAVGAQGIGEAFKQIGSKGDPEKLAAAMKNLAPAARDFVKSTHELAPAWKNLRLDVQERLFAGLGDAMTTLGQRGIPVLRKGLAGMAGELNLFGRNIFGALSERSNLADIGHIFGNLKNVFHEVAQAAKPFVDVLIDITSVGSDFLPGLVAGLGDAARHFADFIKQARASGDLRQFISEGLSTLGELFTVVKNVASGVGAIFQAALPAGRVLLTMLGSITGALAEFLHSGEAQSGLSEFFNRMASTATALAPALLTVAHALTTSVLPAMGGFAQTLAPVVEHLLVGLSEMLEKLSPLIYPALATALGAWFEATAPLIPVITEIVETLLPPFIELMNRLSPIVSEVTGQIGDGLVQAVHALAPLLPVLADAVMAIIEAFQPMVPVVMKLVNDLLPPLVVVLQGVAKAVQFLAPILPPLLAGFLAFKAVGAVTKSIGGLSTRFLDLGVSLEQTAKKTGRFGGSLFSGLSNGAVGAAGATERVGTAVGRMGAALPIVGIAIGAFAEAMAAADEKVNGFAEAVRQGGAAAVEAQKKIADPSLWDRFMADLHSGWDNTKGVAGEVTQALRDQWAAMTPLQQAQSKVAEWQNTLNFRMGKYAEDSPQVEAAQRRLHYWSGLMATQEQKQADATQTATDKLKEQRDAIEEQANTQLAWERAQLRVTDAIKTYNDVQKDATKTDAERKEAELQVRESIISAADAARKKAEADNASKGETAAAKAGEEAYIRTLMDMAAKTTGPAHDALMKMVADLQRTKKEGFITAGQVSDLGNRVKGLPPGHYIKIEAPTGPQMKALQDLGVRVKTLPDGSIAINLDDRGARLKLNTLMSDYGGKPVPIGTTHVTNSRQGIAATGGFTGPGGKYEPAGIVHRGEFVVPKEAVERIGLPFLYGISGLPQGYMPPGFATGGYAGLPGYAAGGMVLPVHWDVMSKLPGLLAKLTEAIKAKFAPVGGSVGLGAGVSSGPVANIVRSVASTMGWGSGAEWAALSWLISHESGFRNTAQNPTSTAYGLFQFLNSTWAGTGIGKTSDPRLQTVAGLRYIASRYGDPIGAQRFWQAHHWYDQGGTLPPGATMAMNGTGQNEYIFTSAQLRTLFGASMVGAVKDGVQQGLQPFATAVTNAIRSLSGAHAAVAAVASHVAAVKAPARPSVPAFYDWDERRESDPAYMAFWNGLLKAGWKGRPGDRHERLYRPYDNGGWLPPGLSTVYNGTGRPEPVLTAAEHDSLMRWRSLDTGPGGMGAGVAGFVNNGTVLTTDLGELARRSRLGTQRALLAAGLA